MIQRRKKERLQLYRPPQVVAVLNYFTTSQSIVPKLSCPPCLPVAKSSQSEEPSSVRDYLKSPVKESNPVCERMDESYGDHEYRCDSERRRQRKKKVTFSSTDEFQEIPHIADLTNDEISSVWMTGEELSAIRRQCAVIIKFMETSKEDFMIPDDICLRGLEQNTLSYITCQMQKRRHLYDALRAVQDINIPR